MEAQQDESRYGIRKLIRNNTNLLNKISMLRGFYFFIDNHINIYREGKDMREKAINIALIVIGIFFLPIFITTLLTDVGRSSTKAQDIVVTIHYKEGEEQMPLETYLIGVVAAEMPVYFDEEALKAQAITARTYTLKRLKENPDIIFTEGIQDFCSEKQLEEMWGVKDYTFYYTRIRNAVQKTSGQVIIYNGELIDAVFHSTSIGMTRRALDVWGQDIPYLQVAESLEDINAPTYLHKYSFDFNDFQDKAIQYDGEIVFSKDLPSEIQIIERNKEGYILSILVGNKIFDGEEFRKIFELASSNFSLSFTENQINIICKGYGHGVGLSQYGAEAMANSGKSYSDIIKHYFKDIEIVSKDTL